MRSFPLPEQHQIPDAAHHAKARPLRQGAHDETGGQADEDGGVEGAGAGACLGEVNEGGGGNQQHQQHHLDDGEGGAFQDGQLVGALEGVAPVEEDHAHQNAADKAQQAEEGIEVAAGPGGGSCGRGSPGTSGSRSSQRSPAQTGSGARLPPRGENSLRSSAMRKLPSTSPRISGRIYCTAPAVCSPSAPEMSRRKQAMQKPMFTGFPNSTSREAMTPMAMPASTMPVFSRFFIIRFLSLSRHGACAME